MVPTDESLPVDALPPGPHVLAGRADRVAARWFSSLCGNLTAGVRLLCFRKVATQRLAATPDQLIALVALGIAVNLGAAFAFVGAAGEFNPAAIPSVVFGALLVLLAGYAVAGLARNGDLAMVVPVAVVASSVSLNATANLIWLGLDRAWLEWQIGVDPMAVYYALYAWWSLAMLLAVSRLARVRRVLSLLAFGLIVLVTGWYLPPGWLWEASPGAAGELAIPSNARFEESVLYAQPGILREALARIPRQRPGIEDLYFVGFAPYGSQDVFMKEVASVSQVLAERYDVGRRAIMLVSNPAVLGSRPIATLTSLRRALRAIGERIDPEEDVVLVHVTTHGSQSHELSVELPPLRLDQIRPQDLRAALDDAGIRWRIVVVSACYSGGFMAALKDARTFVATAADAEHASFGCNSDSDYTYFSRAFYEEGLRQTRSFPGAFEIARKSVAARERKEQLEPSNPQLFVGDAIRHKLAGMERWPQASAAAVRPGTPALVRPREEVLR